MAQQATKGIHSSLEKEAWDLFEVGANEEVIKLAELHSNHFFIQHLSYLASYELNGKVSPVSPKGISPLSPVVEALSNYSNGRYKEAANQISLYFQSAGNTICYGIISLSLKIYFRSENYAEALSVLILYKKKFNDLSFLIREIKRHNLIDIFESISDNKRDIYIADLERFLDCY